MHTLIRSEWLVLAILYFFVMTTTLSLSSCGGGGGGGSDTATNNSNNNQEAYYVQITDPQNPVAAIVVNKTGTESVAIVTQKDANGNPTSIIGIVYANDFGGQGTIQPGADGLPASLTDSLGNKMLFSNYTDSTVDISVYDSSGKLLSGPTTINMDGAQLTNIKNAWNSVNTNVLGKAHILQAVSVSASQVLTMIKYGLIAWSAFKCVGSIITTISSGGTAWLLMPLACASTLLTLASIITGNEYVNQVKGLNNNSQCYINVTIQSWVDAIGPCASLVADGALFIINQTTDNIKPSTPTGLSLNAISDSQINLSWYASTDNTGVSGYNIYRDNVYLKSVTVTSAVDRGLNASTNYCYSVSAYDAANNESAQSAQICASTVNSTLVCNPGNSISIDGIQFYGTPSYQLSTTAANTRETATLTWGAYYQNINNLPTGSYSGSLRAQLYAVPHSFSGGDIINSYSLGIFNPNFTGIGAYSSNQLYVGSYTISPMSSAVTGQNPPAGTYCMVVAIEEYNPGCGSSDPLVNPDWCYEQWTQYAAPITFY